MLAKTGPPLTSSIAVPFAVEIALVLRCVRETVEPGVSLGEMRTILPPGRKTHGTHGGHFVVLASVAGHRGASQEFTSTARPKQRCTSMSMDCECSCFRRA
jgi:hypothetical protein